MSKTASSRSAGVTRAALLERRAARRRRECQRQVCLPVCVCVCVCGAEKRLGSTGNAGVWREDYINYHNSIIMVIILQSSGKMARPAPLLQGAGTRVIALLYTCSSAIIYVL